MTQAAQMPDWMQERLAGSATRPGEVELRPGEAAAFVLFAALGTQWRVHGMSGQRLGLDYAAVPAVGAMMGMAMTPALFGDLRLMEAEALDEFSRERAP